MTEGASFDFEARLRRCQSVLGKRNVDSIALFPSPNLYYLTGFHEEPAERHLLLFVTPEDYRIVAPRMYENQILAETFIDHVDTWDDEDDPMGVVRDVLASLDLDRGVDRVLLDDTMFSRFTLDLLDVFPTDDVGLASTVLGDLRIRKDERELTALREAAAISDTVSAEIRSLGADAVGMTERELVREIERRIEEHGGTGLSFEAIVGSGPNGAQPHYRHGDRTIRSNEPVILDFGAKWDGYPGDQTRTVVFDGEPPKEFETIHEIVREALEAGVDAVAPGVETQEVDRVVRSVIESAGYGDGFLHRTGHGLGLEVHEPPYIVEGDDTVLEPGMVHSIEPGIYLEGEYGARIEDIVVVTEDGCEQLNNSPRTWEPLDDHGLE